MSLTAARTMGPVIGRRHLKLVKDDAQTTLSTTGDYSDQPDRSRYSKQRLLEHVAASIVDVTTDGAGLGFSDDGLIAFLRLIDHLLADGSATPQVSRGPDNGLAVEWLVNGGSMTIFFRSEADISVWGEASDGREVFDYELTSKWSPADPRIIEMRSYLSALSAGVSVRAGLRTYR